MQNANRLSLAVQEIWCQNMPRRLSVRTLPLMLAVFQGFCFEDETVLTAKSDYRILVSFQCVIHTMN